MARPTDKIIAGKSVLAVWLLNLLLPGIGNIYAAGYGECGWPIVSAVALFFRPEPQIWWPLFIFLSIKGTLAVNSFNRQRRQEAYPRWEAGFERTERQVGRLPDSGNRLPTERSAVAGQLEQRAGAAGENRPVKPQYRIEKVRKEKGVYVRSQDDLAKGQERAATPAFHGGSPAEAERPAQAESAPAAAP